VTCASAPHLRGRRGSHQSQPGYRRPSLMPRPFGTSGDRPRGELASTVIVRSGLRVGAASVETERTRGNSMTDGHHPTTLSTPEADRLAFLEARIHAGLRVFVEVGAALMEIRDTRLYRAEFRSFEAYCRTRWHIGRRHGYQMIAAAEIVENVRNCAHALNGYGGPVDNLPLPANESQARPLKRLPPHLQFEAWLAAVETAPGGRVTAAHVDEVVRAWGAPRQLDVHYSSASDEWYTPKHIVQAVLQALGSVDLDPCSDCKINPTVPATNHFTKQDDGLTQPWHGRVYMNPPYGSEIHHWTSKLRSEYESGKVTAAVALVPARTDTRWFRAFGSYPRCFLHGRLAFSNHSTSAPFPSAAVYLGEHAEHFAAAFDGLGHTFIRLPVRPNAK
jgi:hypothetical protein